MVLLVNSTKYLGKKCVSSTQALLKITAREDSFSFYEANALVCVYVCVYVCVDLSGAALGITDKTEARP